MTPPVAVYAFGDENGVGRVVGESRTYRGSLTGSLGCELLTGSLTTSRLASGLLGTGHCEVSVGEGVEE